MVAAGEAAPGLAVAARARTVPTLADNVHRVYVAEQVGAPPEAAVGFTACNEADEAAVVRRGAVSGVGRKRRRRRRERQAGDEGWRRKRKTYVGALSVVLCWLRGGSCDGCDRCAGCWYDGSSVRPKYACGVGDVVLYVGYRSCGCCCVYHSEGGDSAYGEGEVMNPLSSVAS